MISTVEKTIQSDPPNKTPDDGASYFGVPTRAEFLRLVRIGELPPPDLRFGRRLRWRASTFARWAEQQGATVAN